MTFNETKWLMIAFMITALNLKYNKDYSMRDVQYETCVIVDKGKVICQGSYEELTSWGSNLLNTN